MQYNLLLIFSFYFVYIYICNMETINETPTTRKPRTKATIKEPTEEQTLEQPKAKARAKPKPKPKATVNMEQVEIPKF